MPALGGALRIGLGAKRCSILRLLPVKMLSAQTTSLFEKRAQIRQRRTSALRAPRS